MIRADFHLVLCALQIQFLTKHQKKYRRSINFIARLFGRNRKLSRYSVACKSHNKRPLQFLIDCSTNLTITKLNRFFFSTSNFVYDTNESATITLDIIHTNKKIILVFGFHNNHFINTHLPFCGHRFINSYAAVRIDLIFPFMPFAKGIRYAIHFGVQIMRANVIDLSRLFVCFIPLHTGRISCIKRRI